VAQPASTSAQGVPLEYVRMLPWAFGPWLYLLVPVGLAVGLAVRDGSRTDWRLVAWLWWWAESVFVVERANRDNADW